MNLWFIVGAVPIIFVVLGFLFKSKGPKASYKGKTVMVIGGSEGIGRSICEEVLRLGALKVIVVSRNIEKLEIAQSHLDKCTTSPDQQVRIFACDVSSSKQVEQLFEKLKAINLSEIHFVFLCQGMAIPKYFIEQPVEEYERQMQANYFGSLYIAKRVIPLMLKKSIGSDDQNDCHIIFTGSTVSFCSFIGYSSYSPTKYAVRALAETLENEFLGYNIHFHLACPSDTQTPGFNAENSTKPMETKKISDAGKVYDSGSVARSIVGGVCNGDFYLYHDYLTGLVIHGCVGLGPKKYPLLDVLISPILSIITKFVYSDWNGIAERGAHDRVYK